MIGDKITLLIVEGNIDGCNFYRLKQPGLALIDKDSIVCGLSKSMTDDDISIWLDKADVIMTQRTSLKFLKFLKDEKKNKKVIFDSDDNVFKVSPYNPGYVSWGYKEVRYRREDGTMWNLKDGENGFDIERNLKNLACYKQTLELSDLVTTPSPVLSGFYKRFNKNTRVIKNMINFENWYPIKMFKDDWIRIGYQCGWSHYEDFWEIHDALKVIMESYKNIRLVLMGQDYKGAMLDLPQDRIDVHTWIGMEGYPYKLKTLNIDIGIAPLCNNEFNTCKSEIKWEEYSSLEIPTCASNIPPYSLCIKDGITGLLCSDTKDWIKNLSDLIESKSMRERIGIQSRKFIVDNYDIKNGVKQYEDMIKSLFRPEVLTPAC